MFRRTKIIATLGPATDEPQVLDKILAAGVNVVRLNFSHQTAAIHKQRLDLLRERARALGHTVGVIADLQGPKIRIERFVNQKILLREGDNFILDAALPGDQGTEERVGIAYKQLLTDVKSGAGLLLDDGRISLKIKEIVGSEIRCQVLAGGVLSNNKGINLQGGGLSAAALTNKDKTDITLAAAWQVDYIAVSFVRSAADVEEARRLLHEAGGNSGVIAKIERAEALEQAESIIKAADAIMVARGDLGVEVGYAALPSIQKRLIRQARELNKGVITATQMMETMIENPIPTRAEVSDVANAVFDGTDAVMLSAETAAGNYPEAVVKAMDRVCHEAESQPESKSSDHRMTSQFGRVDEAIAMATMYTANHLLNVKAVAALTESGSTPLWMSRICSGIPIFAFSRLPSTCNKVTLYRGVYPINFDVMITDTFVANQEIINTLLKLQVVNKGDIIIITKGDLNGISGGTNLMKIIRVP